jgi:protein TonB
VDDLTPTSCQERFDMTTLIVSGARPRLSKGGITTSVLLHSAIIGAAVLGTAQMVRPTGEKVEEHVLVYEAPKPAPPPAPPKVDQPKQVHVAPKAAAPKAPAVVRYQKPQPKAPVLTAPTKVAVSLPPIDLKAAPTIDNVVAVKVADPGPITRSSSDGDVESKGGSSRGVAGGASHDDGSAYSDNQVEREVQRLPGSPAPRYPESLRSAGVSGEVLLRFIVGTNGRVEPGSIEVVSTPHQAFVDAVRTALLATRFRPAEVGGHAVRQLVEQSFSFKLDR